MSKDSLNKNMMPISTETSIKHKNDNFTTSLKVQD